MPLGRDLMRNGVNTLVGQRSLRGQSADGKIKQALEQSDVFIIVLTQDYLRSASCMEELHWALATHERPQNHACQSHLQILVELYHSDVEGIGVKRGDLSDPQRLMKYLEQQPPPAGGSGVLSPSFPEQQKTC